MKHGFCYIAPEYFQKFTKYFIKDLRYEDYVRRPCYCTPKDENGIFYAIPLSSRVEKHKKKKTGMNFFFTIGEAFGGENRVYCTGNPFPMTERYVKDYVWVNERPAILHNKGMRAKIELVLKRFLEEGKSSYEVHLNAIIAELMEEERTSVRSLITQNGRKKNNYPFYLRGKNVGRKEKNPKKNGMARKRAIEKMREQDLW